MGYPALKRYNALYCMPVVEQAMLILTKTHAAGADFPECLYHVVF
jgi:hypothetical protein